MLLAVAAISTLHLAWLCEWPGHGVDDSLITQVYGRNLAEGDGWVYRPQGERVEGTTSFVYTLLWAAAFRTPAPSAVMQVLGFLLCVLALGLGQAASEDLAGDGGSDRERGMASWWFVILVALFPPLVTWSTITLMDSSLWLAVLMGAAWILVRAENPGWGPRSRAATVALAILMPLARPEGFLVAPAWLGLASLRPGTGAPGFSRRAVPALLVFAGTAAGVTAFRWLYFGHPLPNTYYAKVSPSVGYNLLEGTGYLLRTLVNSPFAAGALVVALVATVNVWRRSASARSSPGTFSQGMLALLALVLVGAAVVVGGDHFAQGRFLVPPLAMALVIAAAVLSRATPTALRRLVTSKGGVALLCVVTMGATVAARALQERRDPVAMEFVVGRCGLEFGRALNRITAGLATRPSWGVFAAGGTAFSYEGPVIDLLGLNNPAMAHSPGERRGRKGHAAFNRAVFYRQDPDVVQESVFTECVNRRRRAFRRDLARGFTGGLQDEPEFRRRYVPMVVRLGAGDRWDRAERIADDDGPCVEGMALYVRRGLSESLEGAGADVVDLDGGRP
jgi:arabinofuranosyltransferase